MLVNILQPVLWKRKKARRRKGRREENAGPSEETGRRPLIWDSFEAGMTDFPSAPGLRVNQSWNVLEKPTNKIFPSPASLMQSVPKRLWQNGIERTLQWEGIHAIKEHSIQKQSIQGDSRDQSVRCVNPSGRLRCVAGLNAYFLGAMNEWISPSFPGSNAFSSWHRAGFIPQFL